MDAIKKVRKSQQGLNTSTIYVPNICVHIVTTLSKDIARLIFMALH